MLTNKKKIISLVALGVCALATIALVGREANIGGGFSDQDFLSLIAGKKNGDARLKF
jgi:hypothetical protein